jgi:hypothetical protein
MAALSAFIPVRISSRVYLQQKLAEFGAPALPQAAVQDLADDAVRFAKAAARMCGKPWRADVTDWLEGQAANVACLLHDDRGAGGRQVVSDRLREVLAAILAKHGVQVPPVDTLKGH